MDRPADRSRKYRHEERPRPGGRHRMGVRQTIDGRFRRAVRRIYRPARQIRRPPGRRTAQRRVVRQLGMQNPDMDAGNGKRIRRTHGLRPAKMDPGPVRLRDRHPGRDRALSERLAEGRRQPLRRKLLRQHGATGPGTRPVDLVRNRRRRYFPGGHPRILQICGRPDVRVLATVFRRVRRLAELRSNRRRRQPACTANLASRRNPSLRSPIRGTSISRCSKKLRTSIRRKGSPT